MVEYGENYNGKSKQRQSVNVRVDPDKLAILEEMRTEGFGFAQTEKNRSDVFNEALGYGLQTIMLRKELGDKDFDKLWRIIHKMNIKRINLDKVEQLIGSD